jgi:hypothetical protein
MSILESSSYIKMTFSYPPLKWKVWNLQGLTEITCDESGNPPKLQTNVVWKREGKFKKKEKRNPPIGPKHPFFSLDIFERRKMLDNFDLLQKHKKTNNFRKHWMKKSASIIIRLFIRRTSTSSEIRPKEQFYSLPKARRHYAKMRTTFRPRTWS